MQYIRLGNTDLHISRLALGTVKFGRNQGVKFPTPFELPTDNAIIELLDLAKQLGVNTLDTAPAYGESESRLGKLLTRRQDWILFTKVGEEFVEGKSNYNFTPEHARKSIERSLKRLNTDYLDGVLVHSDGNDTTIIREFGLLQALAQIKSEGLIRTFGMSTKTVEGGLLALEHSEVIMVDYNPLNTEQQTVIARAHSLNRGVLIKKALMSGHIQKLPGEDPIRNTLQFIVNIPGVSSVLLGTLNPVHLKHAAECLV